jgi:hypothetical protein
MSSQNRQRRLELVRQQPNRGTRDGDERSEWMKVADESVDVVQPSTRPNHSDARLAFQGDRAIEWRENRLREAGILRTDLRKVERCAVVARGGSYNAPSPTAHTKLRTNTPAEHTRSCHTRRIPSLAGRQRSCPKPVERKERLRSSRKCLGFGDLQGTARSRTTIVPAESGEQAVVPAISTLHGRCRNCAGECCGVPASGGDGGPARGARLRARARRRTGEAPRSSDYRASLRVRRSARRDTINGRRFSPEALVCFCAGTRTRRIRTPRG